MLDAVWETGLIVCCVGLSFLLSGMEAGMLALSRLRIRQLMRAGKPKARLLHGYLEDPEQFLWTILVGNTAANLIVISLVSLALLQPFGNAPVLFFLSWTAVLFLLYAFSDLLPKTLFRLYPNRLCMLLVRPFRFLDITLKPLVWMVSWFANGFLRWTGGRSFRGRVFANREELRLVMQESTTALTSEERNMINRVLDLQNLNVAQLVVPWQRVISVTTDTPLEEALDLCRKHDLTRLPVFHSEEPEQKRVAGIFSLKAALYEELPETARTAGDLLRPALTLDGDLRLETALQRMQRDGHRLAVVLARGRREVGIVSLQDILRFIVGEISL